MRLQKFLADAGIASRRGAEELIRNGFVSVDDEVVTEMGLKVGPDNTVRFKGKIVGSAEKKVYYMLNKPEGYLSAAVKRHKDDHLVVDLVPAKERLYPVGRLDKNTTGLLLLTNDGDLALKLTHPRYNKEKEYTVTVSRPLVRDFLDDMTRGVDLGDGEVSQPATVRKVSDYSFRIILKEGKKRQIRRMCQTLGYHVQALHRERINTITLGSLQPGKFRKLTSREIKKLLA